MSILTAKSEAEIQVLKLTVRKQNKKIKELATKLLLMQKEHEEMKEGQQRNIENMLSNSETESLEKEVELLSELEEVGNKLCEWEEKTVGLGDIIDTQTIVSRRVKWKNITKTL